MSTPSVPLPLGSLLSDCVVLGAETDTVKSIDAFSDGAPGAVRRYIAGLTSLVCNPPAPPIAVAKMSDLQNGVVLIWKTRDTTRCVVTVLERVS